MSIFDKNRFVTWSRPPEKDADLATRMVEWSWAITWVTFEEKATQVVQDAKTWVETIQSYTNNGENEEDLLGI